MGVGGWGGSLACFPPFLRLVFPNCKAHLKLKRNLQYGSPSSKITAIGFFCHTDSESWMNVLKISCHD